MENLKIIKARLWFYLLLNASIACFVTLSSYVHVPLSNVEDHFIYIIHFTVLQLTIFGFVFCLTFSKWLFKIVYSLLFLFFSLVSYWVYILDLTISEALVQVALESNSDVVQDVITTPLLVYCLGVIIVLIIVLKTHSKIDWRIKNRKWDCVIAFFCVLLFFGAEYKKRGIFTRKMPYIAIGSIKNYLNQDVVKYSNPISNEISAKNKLNIVFVLGESVRADHLGLNGYRRNTTPLLSIREDIHSFKNIFTPNTYTAKSVPQILTSLSVEGDNKKDTIYSFYSVLNKVDYHTSWIGNQIPEESYRGIVEQNKEVNFIDIGHSVLSIDKKYDIELINYFKEKIENNSKGSFVTLHMIGSHWWYESRYPKNFRKYLPVVDTKYIPSATKEEMINSYDNTILYLDSFLNQLINFLEGLKGDYVLIYLSDHGEILGEDNKWMHAQGNEASKNPACILWFSKKLAVENKHILELVKNKKDAKGSTDFLYHSVLNLIGVEGVRYDERQSLFNGEDIKFANP